MNRTNGRTHIGLIVAGLAAVLSMSVADGLAQIAPRWIPEIVLTVGI